MAVYPEAKSGADLKAARSTLILFMVNHKINPNMQPWQSVVDSWAKVCDRNSFLF